MTNLAVPLSRVLLSFHLKSLCLKSHSPPDLMPYVSLSSQCPSDSHPTVLSQPTVPLSQNHCPNLCSFAVLLSYVSPLAVPLPQSLHFLSHISNWLAHVCCPTVSNHFVPLLHVLPFLSVCLSAWSLVVPLPQLWLSLCFKSHCPSMSYLAPLLSCCLAVSLCYLTMPLFNFSQCLSFVFLSLCLMFYCWFVSQLPFSVSFLSHILLSLCLQSICPSVACLAIPLSKISVCLSQVLLSFYLIFDCPSTSYLAALLACCFPVLSHYTSV